MKTTLPELGLGPLQRTGHESLPLIGGSMQLLTVMRLVDHVAETDASVLIRGESGVGKELVAQAVHGRSRRARQPLVIVDCGSLHENLVQSELFGYERGAFTGATTQREGLFEAAHGGTIFLDEIGEMSLALQVKLLRVLESGTIRRVGSNHEIPVDVRVIAATNRDLDAMVRDGRFRCDLYYRLNMFAIDIPPLRERKSDVPMLFEYFIRNSPIVDKRRLRIDPRVFDLLVLHSWPGNIRELKNAAARAAILSDDGVLEPAHLPSEVVAAGNPIRPQPAEPSANPPADPLTLEAVERHHIQEVLEHCRGNRRRTAAILGISERNLYRRIKDLDSR